MAISSNDVGSGLRLNEPLANLRTASESNVVVTQQKRTPTLGSAWRTAVNPMHSEATA